MTDAHGKHQILDSTVAGESRVAAHRKARRRLILAAGAALPSIYTLGSGAQTAVASNLNCWAKTLQTDPARFTSTGDSWYRAPVYVGDHKGTAAYCVSSPQAGCAPATNWGPSGTSMAGKAPEGSVWIVNGNRVTAGPGMQITNVGPGPRQYGLVYVDQAGTISTLDPTRGANLNAVHGSCWTSILGGRISKLG